MKISQIPATRFGSIQNGQSLKISPNLQLLFGYVDADTTSVRTALRYFYFGRDLAPGQLETDKTEFEFLFESGKTTASRLSDGVRLRNPEVVGEWETTLREIDYKTYRSFFDINFGEGESSGAQFCYELKKRFNVPFGDVSYADRQDREQLAAELKAEVAQINREISNCRAEREQLHQRLEKLEGHHVRPYEFEMTQKQALESRINKLREKLSRLRNHAIDLEDDIELAMQKAVPARNDDARTNLVASQEYQLGTSGVRQTNERLAEQVERIDRQIQRWKNVKLDIDSRLTEMKGDLGNARVDEFDSMFDDLRVVVRASEQKILELLEKADAVGDSVNQLNGLIDLNHQICDSLSGLQDHWRDEIFKGEIDSLKRCSKELDGYLGRLAAKRTRLASHEATARLNPRCQCKSHGHAGPTDLHHVEQLKQEHEKTLAEIQVTENLLNKAAEELESLCSLPDLQNEIELVRQRIQACNHDHSVMQDEKDRLLNKLRQSMIEEKQNSLLIELISKYVSELTAGKVKRLFLNEQGNDIELVNRESRLESFRQADFATRLLTRMAISLGCAKLLADSGYEVPLVWEDPFIGLSSADLSVVVDVLSEFSRKTGQVLLLTNNHFVKQFFKDSGLPALDLPDRYSGDVSPLVPVEKGGGIDSGRQRSYSSATDWSAVNRSFDVAAMDQYGKDSFAFDSRYRHQGTASKPMRSTVSNARGSVRPSMENDNGSSSQEFGASNGRSGQVATSRASGEAQLKISRRSSSDQSSSRRKFYLELSSRVEAAPTIGPKTAEKLEKIGICTVDDLVKQDPEWIAEALNNRRIKVDDVVEWQQQALLVCQVPNLRGHDAQILVACGITNATQLAGINPDSLFDVVGPFARSKDGKKLLRGSTQPDHEEVSNWVRWARDLRDLKRAA